LAFQLIALQAHARELPGVQGGAVAEDLLKRVKGLSTEHVNRLGGALEQAQSDSLKEVLLELSGELMSLSDEITKQYFCHTISHQVEART